MTPAYLCPLQASSLIQTNVSDELDEAGERLLAHVYDVRRCHMELIAGQLKRVGQWNAQVAVGKVIQTSGGLVQNGGRSADGVVRAAVFADLVGGSQCHRAQSSHSGWHSVSVEEEEEISKGRERGTSEGSENLKWIFAFNCF